jgi:hypothetical protein
MVHGGFVAATETLAIVSAGTSRNVRMTIFIAVIDVRSAVVVVILAGAFDSIVKALALYVAKLLRRIVPGSIMVAVLTIGRGR